MPPTLVHLVRHGQVENPRRLVYGRQAGWHLSACGRDQVRAVAQRLAAGGARAIYASPLERAQETAALIAEALVLEVQTCEELMESTFAAGWEGRPWDEVRAQAQGEWETYRHDPLALPSAEPLAVLAQRMAGAIRALARAHEGGEAIAVSHGDPIRAGVLALTGGDLGRLHHLRVTPGSLLTLELDGASARVRERWPEGTATD